MGRDERGVDGGSQLRVRFDLGDEIRDARRDGRNRVTFSACQSPDAAKGIGVECFVESSDDFVRAVGLVPGGSPLESCGLVDVVRSESDSRVGADLGRGGLRLDRGVDEEGEMGGTAARVPVGGGVDGAVLGFAGPGPYPGGPAFEVRLVRFRILVTEPFGVHGSRVVHVERELAEFPEEGELGRGPD